MEIVESKFTVKATRQRVWDLLPFAIYNAGEGMEKINVLSERFFRAEMPVKLGFLRVKTQLTGEIFNIREPEALAVALSAKLGMIQVNQKIFFTLSSEANNETEVNCKVEGSGPIFKILGKKLRATSRTTIDNIAEILRRLA